MNKLPKFAAIALLSTCIPVMAQDVAEKKEAMVEIPANLNTSNDVAFAMSDIMINIFTELVAIKDDAGAKSFTNSVEKASPKLTALAEKIKTLPKPTEAELQVYAERSVKLEKEMMDKMQMMMTLMMNPDNQEIAKTIQTGMGEFQKTAQALQPTMEEYYPQTTVKPLMDKIKAEAAE